MGQLLSLLSIFSQVSVIMVTMLQDKMFRVLNIWIIQMLTWSFFKIHGWLQIVRRPVMSSLICSVTNYLDFFKMKDFWLFWLLYICLLVSINHCIYDLHNQGSKVNYELCLWGNAVTILHRIYSEHICHSCQQFLRLAQKVNGPKAKLDTIF